MVRYAGALYNQCNQCNSKHTIKATNVNLSVTTALPWLYKHDLFVQVRMSAITYLQRALLVHDLQTLMAPEWESCFNKVLFPLLAKLLEPISPQDPTGMEETRMRAATVLSKVFLHHLTPLLSLPTFTALWLTILDFMDKYMHVDRSDLLVSIFSVCLHSMNFLNEVCYWCSETKLALRI